LLSKKRTSKSSFRVWLHTLGINEDEINSWIAETKYVNY
jgi:hypothetical protein